MERYLCKAKSLEGEWVTGYYLLGLNKKHTIVCSSTIMTSFGRESILSQKSIDISTICQCTGMKDGNGKLIFEGDYFWIENAEGEIGVIYWYGMRWCVRSVPNTVENECVPDFDTTIEIYELEEFYSREIGIVGNVHDYKGESNGRE